MVTLIFHIKLNRQYTVISSGSEVKFLKLNDVYRQFSLNPSKFKLEL